LRLDEASRGDEERFKTTMMMAAVGLRRARSRMAELKRPPRAANERASKQARNAISLAELHRFHVSRHSSSY
jgi:hypothetical protein